MVFMLFMCVVFVSFVVIYRAFFYFLLHNHIINIKKKSFSGDVNYEANVSFFF